MLPVHPQKASSRPPAPLSYCASTPPPAGQKASYSTPPVPRIDSSVFFPGKKMHALSPPTQEWLNRLKEHQPPLPPSHTGFNEAALIRIVWVCVPLGIKLHTHRGGYGVCLYGGPPRPEFTWSTTTCSATHSINT